MVQSQNQFLTDIIIIKQNDLQKEMIKEMEHQRLWEKEIIEKEHAFQKEDTIFYANDASNRFSDPIIKLWDTSKFFDVSKLWNVNKL